MDPIPRPRVALEELARVLNVWAERHFIITSSTAITQWARQTAAFTPRHPYPAVGITILTKLGLATLTGAGKLCPHPALPSLMPVPAEAFDHLPLAVAGNVFQRLLALPDCAIPIQHVLSCVRVNDGQLSVPWREIPETVRANAAWLWLQQLGLARHADSNLVLDPILLPYVADSPPTHASLSKAELDERLAAQQARAALAEDYVVGVERQRLIACGCPHYAVGVRRVSLANVEAGYDIRSFEVTGAPRFIEVKSSAGPRSFFLISRNEYRFARRHGLSYWIAWVGWAARLPDGECEVAWFRNPVAVMKSAGSPWRVATAQLHIQRLGDDTSFQTAPVG